MWSSRIEEGGEEKDVSGHEGVSRGREEWKMGDGLR